MLGLFAWSWEGAALWVEGASWTVFGDSGEALGVLASLGKVIKTLP